MKVLSLLAGVLCASLLFAPALSAPALAAPAPASEADARMAAAMDLIDAMGGREAIMFQISRVVPSQMQELQTQFPNMSAEMRGMIERSMREEMARGVNRLLSQMAGAWAERFTARELREISAFHRSPAGRKLRAEQQDLQRELSDIGRVWGEEIGKRIQQRLREETTRSAPLTS
jgi:hypothetical protein